MQNRFKLIGMGWYDNSADAPAVKVEKAIAYFRDKYGYEPEHIGVPVAQYPLFAEDERVFPAELQKNNMWLIMRGKISDSRYENVEEV